MLCSVELNDNKRISLTGKDGFAICVEAIYEPWSVFETSLSARPHLHGNKMGSKVLRVTLGQWCLNQKQKVSDLSVKWSIQSTSIYNVDRH